MRGLGTTPGHLHPAGSHGTAILNGFGAVEGGIVRVHNEVLAALADSGTSVWVANAPQGQVDHPGVTTLSRQGDSRARSFLGDIVASRRRRRFDLRIDSAPGLRFNTRSARHVVLVHDLNFLDPSIHRIGRAQLAYRRMLHHWILRRTPVIVAFSEQTRAEIRRLLPRAAERCRVMPLPVTHLARQGAARTGAARSARHAPTAVDRDDRVVRLLSFGHAANKGIDRILSAMAQDASLELSVACRPEHWDRWWSQQARDLGVSDRVRVLGRISDPELVAAYLACDVFCMLSTYEGYGLPVAEALLLGRATIISDLPVLRETSRGYAVVVEGDAPDAVLSAVHAARSSGAERWAQAAEEFADWTWTDFVSELRGPSR